MARNWQLVFSKFFPPISRIVDLYNMKLVRDVRMKDQNGCCRLEVCSSGEIEFQFQSNRRLIW